MAGQKPTGLKLGNLTSYTLFYIIMTDSPRVSKLAVDNNMLVWISFISFLLLFQRKKWGCVLMAGLCQDPKRFITWLRTFWLSGMVLYPTSSRWEASWSTVSRLTSGLFMPVRQKGNYQLLRVISHFKTHSDYLLIYSWKCFQWFLHFYYSVCSQKKDKVSAECQ